MNERLRGLYNYAYRNGYYFINMSFSKTKKAMCACFDDLDTIVMDNRNIHNESEETSLLIEEIGHLETGALYSLDDIFNPNFQTNILKAESTAKIWAIKNFISKEELESAIYKGYHETWQLSDYLDLPELYINKALEYYGI